MGQVKSSPSEHLFMSIEEIAVKIRQYFVEQNAGLGSDTNLEAIIKAAIEKAHTEGYKMGVADHIASEGNAAQASEDDASESRETNAYQINTEARTDFRDIAPAQTSEP